MLPAPPQSRRIILTAFAALCVGCIGLRRRAQAPPIPLGQTVAETVSFHGWHDCVRLANNVVSITTVPQIGGRTLDYRLGAHNFLLVGGRDLGALPEPERPYRHFGGHFAQLHPEERWRVRHTRYPVGLPMGAYEARIVADAGPVAAAEMTLAADLVTGTRLVRRIELFADSTRVRITDTLTNLRAVPQAWGLHDFLQLKGHPAPDGVLSGDERPTGQIGLYVPTNPESRYPHGVRFVIPGQARDGVGQWTTAQLPGLLALRYRRLFSKALIDPVLPWIAVVDHSTDHVFVQRCDVRQKTLLTAGGGYPLIEIQSFAPAAELAPRRSAELAQEWFAARCPGPVLDVTDAGVVSSPLTLLRGDDGIWAAGTFGVFHIGTASLAMRGADGAELARVDCGPVHPHHAFVLNQRIDLPQAVAEVALELRGRHAQPLGHLGIIRLGTR